MNFIKIFNKDSIAEIAFKLKNTEFACRCNFANCRYTLVSNELIEAFGLSRAQFNKPLIINSGFRCQKHNEVVGGSLGSKHTIGAAIDISIVGLDDIEKARLISILRQHFDFVKVYPTFIHCQKNG